MLSFYSWIYLNLSVRIKAGNCLMSTLVLLQTFANNTLDKIVNYTKFQVES